MSAALRTFASPAATTIYTALDEARSSDDLDRLSRLMWKGYGEGAISDDDATFLGTCIDRQRPRAGAGPKPAGKAFGRLASRMKPRGRQGSPDRQASRERRRMLGGSAVLPPQLRCKYTEGQRAVLTIVAGEAKHHGICDLPIDKIAALAGVSRTTVQTTLHEARRLFHIKVTERPQWGRKNLTNVVRIIPDDWTKWLKRGPTAHRPAMQPQPAATRSRKRGPQSAANLPPDRVQNTDLVSTTKNTLNLTSSSSSERTERQQGSRSLLPPSATPETPTIDEAEPPTLTAPPTSEFDQK